ncbi:MAG: CdaR family protein [Deltaproteobacteria bacterium]|nr:CdaR family protein [Deltaproteobacteria bacterium]
MEQLLENVRRYVKEAFTLNLGLKAIALVIAVVFFVVIRSQEQVERWVDVDVVVKPPAPERRLTMTSEAPATVRLFLRGPRSWIGQAKPGDVPAVVMDVSERGEGASTFYFMVDMFEIPTGLSVVRVTPDSIRVKMERVVARHLPVEVKTTGELTRGAELVDRLTVVPAELDVEGASSKVKALRSIETEALDLTSMGVGDHTRDLPLRLLDGVFVEPRGDVRVTLKVRWTQGQRRLTGLDVRVVGTSLPAEVRPPRVSVMLAGSTVALEKLDTAAVIPTVRLLGEAASKPGMHESGVEVLGLPDGVKANVISPDSVQVKLLPPAGRQRKPGD